MKTALIIPVYQQIHLLPKILESIRKQTLLPDKIFITIDRPDDDKNYTEESYEKIKKDFPEANIARSYGLPKKIGNPNDDKKLFLAPYIRNSRIANAVEEGCDVFIFTDGDCVLQPHLIQSHVEKLQYKIPVLSIGRRRERKFRWQDQREYEPNLCHLELFRRNGIVINNPELLKKSLVVWSCNVGLNLKAVKMLQKFNMKYYNRNEVFSSEFNGKWGGEDGFLGIQAWHCRVFISTIGDKSSGVEHIDHPRPEDKYNINHREFFEKQIENLRLRVKLNPLELDFFV